MIPKRGLGIVSPPGYLKRSGTSILSPKPGAPRPIRIFSKPLTVNGVSGIPIKSSKKTLDGTMTEVEGSSGNSKEGEDVEMVDTSNGGGVGGVNDGGVPKTPGTITRQRTFTRKPRISRSKVIARLASQRAASHSSSSFRPTSGGGLPSTPLRTKSGVGVGATPRASGGGMKTHNHNKRVRSSFAPTRSNGRSSFGGGGVSGSSSGGGRGSERERLVLASAKKRVRQSEYARRRSRVSGIGIGIGGVGKE